RSAAGAAALRSGTCATPRVGLVVENGGGRTTALPQVSALNRADLPELGRPTRPRRSTAPRLLRSTSLPRSCPRRLSSVGRRARRRPTTASGPTPDGAETAARRARATCSG